MFTHPKNITENDLMIIGEALTRTLSGLEFHILKHQNKPKKIDPGILSDYLRELNATADLLKKISAHYFVNLKTNEGFFLHDHIEKQTPAYLQLNNARENLSAMILYNITSQPSSDVCLFTAERWAYLLKLSFERNDYFTFMVIASALNDSKLSKIGVPKLLSRTAQYIVEYSEKMMLKPVLWHAKQESKLYTSEQLIPSLTSLAHVLQTVESQPNCADAKQHIKQQKINYSKTYQSMQSALTIEPCFLTLDLVQLLNKPCNKLLLNSARAQAKEIPIKNNKLDLELDLNLIMKMTHLYQPYDIYYQHECELLKSITLFESAYMNPKGLVSSSINKIMHDPKQNYTAKLRSIIEIEDKYHHILSEVMLRYISTFKFYLKALLTVSAHMPKTMIPIPQKEVKAIRENHATLFHSSSSTTRSGDEVVVLTNPNPLSPNFI